MLYKAASILVLGFITFILVSALFSPDAHTEETFIGVSYGTVNSIADFTNVTGIIGHQFNEFLGIEGRASFSSSIESYNNQNAEIDSLLGIYISAAIPIEDSTSIYVMYGHSEGDIAYNEDYGTASHKLASSSLGFGMRYFVLEAYTIFAEYLELADEEEHFVVGARLNF